MSVFVMSAVWKHAPVEQGQLLVLLALADFADDDGWCFPAVDTLAAKSRMAGRSVQRAIRAMQEAGFLHVEANAGPGGANRYRVDTAALSQAKGGDKLSPHDGGEGGDTGVTGGVTSATGGGDTGVTLTVIEPSEEPSVEREGAGARAGASAHQASARGEAAQASINERTGARGEAAQPSDHERSVLADMPDTGPTSGPEPEGGGETAQAPESPAGSDETRKALAQRVRAMEFGPAGGKPWPGAKGSSTEWATARFAELTPDERHRAETLRDAYLAACEAERVKPVALGVYFRDRKFEGLNPELAKRAAAAAGPPKPEAAPFGPVWAALRMRALLAGPECETGTEDPFAASVATHAAMLSVSEATAASWRERNGLTLADGALAFPQGFAEAWRLRQQAAKGWPSVARMDSWAGVGAAMPCGEADLALRELCEPVPIGSQVWREWEGEFAARGWPWLPKCGARPVVYFPKGGPDGLDEFKARLEG